MNYGEYFDYVDGKLYWKARVVNNKHDKAWNTKNAGVEAGSVSKLHGYRKIRLNGRMLYAHRIVWEMHNGKIPNGYEIDHIDHNRDNNNIKNLRCVHPSVNDKNLSLPKTSTTGVIGVSYDNQRGKYRAYIVINGKYKTIGRYSTICEATAARKAYSKAYGFHDNHGM